MFTSLPMDAKQLFISYSRVDAPYARALAEALTALGFTLWRDRSNMEGGENWWQQIEEAIRSVDTMILLLSDAALESKIVGKEWRYARQVGTRVIPVIADSFPPERAPRWMSKRDWYDFRRRDQDPDQQVLWEKLLVQLRAPYQRKRVPFMAEDVPVDYVPRKAELGQVITRFINENREEPRAGIVALKGAGGYGKTTLARAVCADERIQVAFDDGILWVTFGEKVENLTGKVDDLVYALTGRHSNANTLETATAELTEAIGERDLLLVLDDVWSATDIRPFLQGGPRCARLITTRDGGTLPPGTQKIAVDEMSYAEAVTLLRSGLPTGEDTAFERLAERLGYWALLIKLVNGSLRDAVLDFRQPLPDALADMNQGLNEGGLTVFDTDNTPDRNKAVRRTLELSLGRLSGDEKERFEQLVIFPEDIDIPLDVVSRLWGISSVFTRKLCGRLFNMSLLFEYNLETGSLRLHDIIRDYLKQSSAALTEASNSGKHEPEAALHNKLLNAYRLKDWSDLPETDRYMWKYLSWHLLHARRVDEFTAAATNINFLAKKSVILNPFEAENDLIWLEQESRSSDHGAFYQKLRLQFARLTHILERCTSAQDAAAVIWNRVLVNEPSPLRDTWAKSLLHPLLSAERPLPDMPSAALFRTLDGHRDSIKGVAFSPDGKQLVSVGDDRALRLWSVERGQAEREPLRVTSEGRSIAWSADGTLIAAAFRNGAIALYNPDSWVEQARWNAHDHQVRGIAFSPDGQQIASVSRDQTVKLWDRQGALRRTLTGHGGSVEAVTYSADGSLIASCDQAGVTLVWGADSGAERYRLAIPGGHSYSLAFSPDDKQIAIGGSGGRVAIWEMQNGNLRVLHGQSGDVRGVVFSPRGGHLVSGSADRTAVLWRTDTWSVQEVWADHLGIVRTVAWDSHGGYVATGASDRAIKLWVCGESLTNQSSAESTPGTSRGTYYSIAYAADGRLIVLEKSGKVFALDPTGAQPVQPIGGFRNDTKFITCSPGGNWILGLADSAAVKRWDARTNKRSGFLAAEEGAVLHTASYSPDEQRLVTTAGNNTLQIRDAQQLTLIRSWTVPGDITFNHAGYSPDGQTVIAAVADGSILLWSPETDSIQTLTGHQGSVNSAAYSPDGRYIGSVSSDRTLRIWEAGTGRNVHIFHADGGLYSLAWHPDSVHVVVGGARGVYWLKWG